MGKETDGGLAEVHMGDRARICPVAGGFDAYMEAMEPDEDFGPEGLILLAFRALAPTVWPVVGDREVFDTYMQLIENKTLLMHLFFEEDHVGVHVAVLKDVEGVKARDAYVRVVELETIH